MGGEEGLRGSFQHDGHGLPLLSLGSFTHLGHIIEYVYYLFELLFLFTREGGLPNKTLHEVAPVHPQDLVRILVIVILRDCYRLGYFSNVWILFIEREGSMGFGGVLVSSVIAGVLGG